MEKKFAYKRNFDKLTTTEIKGSVQILSIIFKSVI